MKILSIGVIYNPISGAGRGSGVVTAVTEKLHSLAVRTVVKESSRNYQRDDILSFLKGVDRVAIVGGDGTLRGLLPYLAEAKTPFTVFPAGVESLFSKRFLVPKQLEQFISFLLTSQPQDHFVASVNNSYFFTMASVGFDAQTVESLSSSRMGPVGRFGYLSHILKTLCNWSVPRIELRIDGEERLSGEQGLLIIANNSGYALDLPFVPEANSLTPELCCRFLSYSGLFSLLKIVLGVVLGGKSFVARFPLWRGRAFQVNVQNEGGQPVQADGEYLGRTPVLIKGAAETIRVLIA